MTGMSLSLYLSLSFIHASYFLLGYDFVWVCTGQIILLSCCVKQGSIYVLEISASAEEWKKNGPSLRSVRDSFRVPKA